jgi:hypothetical protein
MAFPNVFSRHLTGKTEEEQARHRHGIQACGRNLSQGNSEYEKKVSMDSWLWHYFVVSGQSLSSRLHDPNSQLSGTKCHSEYEAKIVPDIHQ